MRKLKIAVMVLALCALGPAAVSAGDKGGPIQVPPMWRMAKVEMYTTAWCGYCKKARAWFKARRILFTDYDIEKDLRAKERKKGLGSGKGVPVVVINGKVTTGFSPKAYEKALSQH